MITKIGTDLHQMLYDKYITKYDTLDAAHGREHIDTVLGNVKSLSKGLTSAEMNQAYAAGLLHDVGLAGGRDGHARRSAAFVRRQSKYLGDSFTPDDLKSIVHAVRNHRSSTGNPQTTVGKVVADADRIDVNPIKRSYSYHISKLNEAPDIALREAAAHIASKYGDGGPGRKYHFPLTEKLYKKYYDPAIAEYNAGAWDKLKARVA